MPCRNIVKMYDVNTYYHLYNRGVEKRKIFLDDQDYAVFMGLLKRHLDVDLVVGSHGRQYKWLADEVEIIAFCLMPNHFHLLLYQIEIDAVTKLLRAVCSSYVAYFNNKYDRVGPLFQGIFKAVKVDRSDYLLYLTWYIHRNPSNYMEWEWSSLSYWLGRKSTSWIKPQRLNEIGSEQYIDFIKGKDDHGLTPDEISKIILQ